MVERNITAALTAVRRPPVQLARCVILDSRFSSQQRLKFDLGKSSLFKEIEIASEVDHGLSIVRDNNADVCVIGPTVTLQAATRFLVTTKRIPSRSCALVALSSKPGSAMALKMSGADEVMEGSYSNAKLSKTVVKAVVRVKPDQRWSDFLEELERDDLQGVRGNSSQEFVAKEFSEILEVAGPLLNRVATGVRKGFYGRDDQGKLSVLTKSALSRVVETLLDGREVGDEKTRHFLLDTLERWVLDIMDLGEGIAKLKLKNRLLKGG